MDVNIQDGNGEDESVTEGQMELRGSSFTFLHLSGCSVENMDQAPTRLGLEPHTAPGQSGHARLARTLR